MYDAVLDSAAGMAYLSVFECGREVFSSTSPMHGREAAKMPSWVSAELDARGMKLSDIGRWTVGAGPGSFTGLRLAAALVAGWCYGMKNSCRAVPGALGMAAAAKLAANERMGCLYDGRNHEMICFEVIGDGCGHPRPTGESAILDAAAAREYFAAHPEMRLSVFEPELSAILKLVPDLKVIPVSAPDLSALEADETVPFDDDVTRLVYIRPAVYTDKK